MELTRLELSLIIACLGELNEGQAQTKLLSKEETYYGGTSSELQQFVLDTLKSGVKIPKLLNRDLWYKLEEFAATIREREKIQLEYKVLCKDKNGEYGISAGHYVDKAEFLKSVFTGTVFVDFIADSVRERQTSSADQRIFLNLGGK